MFKTLLVSAKGFMAYFVIILLIAIAGFISALIMGKDNAIEKAAENFIDQEVESKFHLPSGTVNVDLSPDEN